MSGTDELSGTKIYLDTMIFIYALERPSNISLDICDALARLLIGKNVSAKLPHCFTSELTFSECWVRPYRDKNAELIAIYQSLSEATDLIGIGAVALEILRLAAIIRAQRTSIKLPDAIHLATAIGFGCPHFLSNDIPLSGNIQIAYSGSIEPISIEIVRPDNASISRLIDVAND